MRDDALLLFDIRFTANFAIVSRFATRCHLSPPNSSMAFQPPGLPPSLTYAETVGIHRKYLNPTTYSVPNCATGVERGGQEQGKCELCQGFGPRHHLGFQLRKRAHASKHTSSCCPSRRRFESLI